MAKTKISEFDVDPANNTDINNINIAEGCAPSGINNAIRQLMSDLKEFQTGAGGDPFNGAINGTVGATTPSTGAFTTLSASGAFAANGGATLGDASGDALTINSSAVSIPNGLNFDSNTFVIDATNNNIGIGTATPTGVGSNYRNLVLLGNNGSNIDLNDSSSTVRATISTDNSGGNALFVDTRTSHPIVFRTTSGTLERMRIASNGNVGIGTNNPSHILDVSVGSGSPTIRLLRTSSAGADLRLVSTAVADGAIVGTYSDSPLLFVANSSERMRITSAGNVGIGTSSPNGRLNIAAAQDGNLLSLSDNSAIRWAYYLSSNRLHLYNYATSSDALVVSSSGNLGLGVTPNTWTLGKSVSVGDVGSAVFGFGGYNSLTSGAYFNSGWKYSSSSSSQKPALFVGSDGGFSWSTAAAGTAGNAITFTQAMTLDASGNLGIGTTSPSVRLQVQSATTNTVMAVANTGSDIQIQSNGSDGYINMTGTGNTIFRMGSGFTERMRITSGGYTKMSNSGGYDGPTGTYHEMYQTANDNTVKISSKNASLTTDGIQLFLADRNTTNNTFYVLSYYNIGAGAFKFRVADSGNVTNTNNSYGAISDLKLKENIVDATPKLEKLNQVRVVNYNFIGSEEKQLGVVAQELEAVFPSMVEESVDKDAEGNDLGTTTKSVKYSVFVPMLIKALQEQQAIINDLKARIETLESK
jgi:hypothetical protein